MAISDLLEMVQKYEGYPSGSMVDFACDADGSPILAVSSLAVHTKVCCLFLTISRLLISVLLHFGAV